MQKIFSYLGFEVLIRFSEDRLVRVELTGRKSNAIELPSFKPDLSTFSHFDRIVMKAAMKIPMGRVTTYMALADAAGRQKAARAAGSVMAKNPFAIVVPCHRVIRSDLSQGGYFYGTEIKRSLLEAEGVKFKGDKVEKEFVIEIHG